MDDAKTETAMRYATDWYTYHAGQRMTAVRFYLAIIGVLLLAYVQSSSRLRALAVAMFAALVSFVFWVLDVRNTELVNCGRAALDQLESDVGLTIRADDSHRRYLSEAVQFLKKGNGTKIQRATTFQLWLRTLYVVTFLGAIVAAGAAASASYLAEAPASAEAPAYAVALQTRTLRTMVEGQLLVAKQDTDSATLAAGAKMLETEVLAVLRTCRLEFGADAVCDRYEAWSDQVLAELRPAAAQAGQARETVRRFGATYGKTLRSELANIERAMVTEKPIATK
jgi:hypothetical protein